MSNAVLDKSKAFAVRIIKLYKMLNEDKKEYILSKQVLRSGTSVGANIREAMRGQSKADFYSKLNIALKEADETAYWLELLFETDYITKLQFDSVYKDCEEIISLLVSITKKQKTKYMTINSAEGTVDFVKNFRDSEFRFPNSEFTGKDDNND